MNNFNRWYTKGKWLDRFQVYSTRFKWIIFSVINHQESIWKIIKKLNLQNWKHGPSQVRLLLALDAKGFLNMSLIEPNSQKSRTPKDYKSTMLGINLKHVNVVDKIALHRQRSEILFRGFLQNTTNLGNCSPH